MLTLRMEMTEGLKAASSFPAGLLGGALAAGSTVGTGFSPPALLSGAGLNRGARLDLWREKKNPTTFPRCSSTPEVVDNQMELWGRLN